MLNERLKNIAGINLIDGLVEAKDTIKQSQKPRVK
jgi:hypothetical protein